MRSLPALIQTTGKNWVYLWWILVFVAMISLYKSSYVPLPNGVHSWAQSDRYALACMYFDDLNFFAPKTYNLMSEHGRVGVEFPALPYASAFIAKIIGRAYLPLIMRGLNLLMLFVSLVFLSNQVKKNDWLVNILFLSILFSPLLIFYAFNFLPDTTGLAFVLIAFGFLFRFSGNKKSKNWILALLFSAFSAALKTTCGIYFLAIGGSLFLHFIHQKDFKSIWKLLSVGLILGLLVAAYDYFFFYEINKKYWSIIFMSSPQPIQTWSDFNLVYKGFKYWFGQWITVPQLIVFLVLILGRFIWHKPQKSPSILTNALWISAFGVILFIKMMGLQFINHDYYFIASIIPLLFLWIAILSTGIEKISNVSQRIFYGLTLSISVIYGFILCYNQYPQRNSSHFTWKNRTILNDVDWMRNGAKTLDTIGLPANATIFVLYEFAPNTPLVYFDKKGKVFNHEEMTREPENIKYWMERIQPDYVLLQSKWSSNFNRDQPQLAEELLHHSKQGEIVIYKTKY